MTRKAWQAEQSQARALSVAKKALSGEVPADQIDPTAAAILLAEIKQKEVELRETEQARDDAQADAAKGWKTVDEIRECLTPKQWSWLVEKVQEKRKQAAADAGPSLG